MGTSRFVELGHELEDGMAPYPGLPTPRIGPHLDHEREGLSGSRSRRSELVMTQL
jgi:kynurenine formamidase